MEMGRRSRQRGDLYVVRDSGLKQSAVMAYLG